MMKEHIQMKAWNDVSNNQKLRILDVPPCSLGPAPSIRKFDGKTTRPTGAAGWHLITTKQNLCIDYIPPYLVL